MDPDHAMDDLKVIRRVMERIRRATEGYGGWFMILWGAIWLLGFLGTHFLFRLHLNQAVNWMWMGLNGTGVLLSIWLGVRFQRHGAIRSSSWTVILLWWLALAGFDGLIIWLFELRGSEITLVILLTIALGYFQFGLFTHWIISLTGLFIAILSVGAALLFPSYFNLAIAVLGGGVLIASGLWFIRRGK